MCWGNCCGNKRGEKTRKGEVIIDVCTKIALACLSRLQDCPRTARIWFDEGCSVELQGGKSLAIRTGGVGGGGNRGSLRTEKSGKEGERVSTDAILVVRARA